MIFVANHLSCVRLDRLILETADCIHVKITLPDNVLFKILGLYRVHEFSPIRCTEELDIYLNSITDQNLVICGYMNIN